METEMLILVTHKEIDRRTGHERIIVSHGVNEHTGQTVILPQETPESLGARYDRNMCEYVLDDVASEAKPMRR